MSHVRLRTIATKLTAKQAGEVMIKADEQDLTVSSYLKKLIDKDFSGGVIDSKKRKIMEHIKCYMFDKIDGIKGKYNLPLVLENGSIKIIKDDNYDFSKTPEENIIKGVKIRGDIQAMITFILELSIKFITKNNNEKSKKFVNGLAKIINE